MTVRIGTIEGLITLRDELSTKLEQAASNMEKSGKRFQKVGRQISDVGTQISKVGLPMAALGVAAFKLSADFSESLTKIETLVGVNRDVVQGWRKDILALSGETARAPRELADAMFFVTSAGLRGEAALEALDSAARAAALGLGETQAIADATTSAMNAYGPAVLSASRATNILALAVRAGKLEASELAPVMGRLLPTASSLGIAFEDVAGSLAVMSRTGLNAAEASTSLNSIMNLLAKGGTKQARDVMDQIGLSMGDLRDIAAQPGGLIEAMRLLNERTSELSDEALARVIPNIRAFRGVMNVLAQDASVVDDVMGQVASGVDVVGEGMERVQQEAGFKFNQFLQEAKIRLIELGDELTPAFEQLFKIGTKLLELLGGLVKVFADLPGPIKAVTLALGGLFIATGPVLIVTGQLITAWGTILATAPGVAAAIASVSAALLPVAIALGGAIALRAMIRQWADSLVEDMDRIAERTNKAGRAWNQLRLEITQGLGLVSQATFEAAKAEAEALRKGIEASEKELQKLKKTGEDVVEVGHVGLEQESKRARELKEQIKIDKDRLAIAENQLDAAKDGLERSEKLREKSEEIAQQFREDEKNRIGALQDQSDAVRRMIEQRLRLVQISIDLTDQIDANKLLLEASAEEADLIRLAMENGIDPLTELTKENRDLLKVLQNQTELLENQSELQKAIADSVGDEIAARNNLALDPLMDFTHSGERIIDPDELLEAMGLGVEAVRERAEEMADALTEELLEGLEAPEKGFKEFLGKLDDGLVELGQTIASVAKGIDEDLGRVVEQVISLVQSLQAAADNAGTLEGAIAGMGVGLGVAGIAQSLGIFKGQRGTGSFGGELSGDFSDIGGAVGGAIGSLFGPVGTVVGAVLGTVIGGAIKSGADEGLAELQVVGGEVGARITRMEGGLGPVITDLAQAVAGTINDVLDQIGGELVALPGVQFKIRDDVITVFVNGIRRQFSEIQDAIGFATAQALKTATVKGLSPAVQAALRDSANDSAEALLENIATGIQIQNLGIPEAAIRIQDEFRGITIEFDRLVEKATEWGLALSDLSAIGEEFLAGNLQSIRDQITGVVKSQRETFEERRAMFNAELELLRADLMARRDALAMQIDLARARLETQDTVLTAEQEFLRGLGEFAQGIGLVARGVTAMAGFTEAQIEAMLGRLAALDAALENLPDLIGADEFRPRGGGGRRQALESFEATLQRISDSLLPQFTRSLLDLSRRYAELLEQARRFGRSEEEILDLRRREAQALSGQIRDSISEFLTPAQGGTFGLSDPQAQAAGIRERFAEILEQTRLLMEQEGELALTREEILEAERRALELLSESVIDGLGLPLEETRNRIGDLRDSLGFLWQQTLAGEMAFERFAEIIAQAGDQAFLSLGDSILGFVDRYGIEVENMEEFRLKLERVRFELERANLFLMFELIREIGILTEEMIGFIEGALGEIMALEFPDIQAPSRRPATRPSRTIRPEVDPVVERDTRLEELQRILEGWRDSAQSSAFQRLQELREQRKQALDLARQLGENLQQVRSAFLVALKSFTDSLLEGVRGVRDEIAGGAVSLSSGALAPGARLAQAEENLRKQVADVLGGNLDAVDEVDDLANTALSALANLFDPLADRAAFQRGASEIDRLLDLVEQQVESQALAQTTSDAPQAPADAQTQQQILAALSENTSVLRQIRDEDSTDDQRLMALLTRLVSSQETLVQELGRRP